MPKLTDLAQLQAVAQTAKSFILDKDSDTVDTIIDALEQGGGSSGSSKQEGIITLDGQIGLNITAEKKMVSISYNGDGQLHVCNSNSVIDSKTIENNTIMMADGECVLVYANATDNYTAAVARIFYND